jgi:hypothetical protein
MAEIPSGTKFIGIDASIPTPELNGARINNKTQHYTVEDIAAFAGVGSEGPQGIQGPAGPPGPVGPAGLEWQGSWDTDSSYSVDDAVGFNGASWFCISEVTGTGNPNPEVDTTSWALLAAQGAIGPQGAQGPTGPQGPAGSIVYTDSSLNSGTFSQAATFAKVTNDFTRVFVTSDSANFVGISDVGVSTGDYYVLQNKSTTRNLIVRPLNSARFLQPSGSELDVNFVMKPNTYARFTLTNITGGSDRVFMVEVINPLGNFLPYKTYVAQIIPESSSVITTNVLENTLGTTVTVSWVSGNINIILGSNLITLTNPYLSASNYFQNGIYHLVTPSLLGFDTIQLASYKVSGTPSAGWSFGARINFELRLYN